MPETVVKGLYFQNNDVAFQSALSKGDVREITGEDGKKYFSFQEYKVGREDGKSTKQTVNQKEKIDKAIRGDLMAALADLKWSFGGKSKGEATFQDADDGKLNDATKSLLKQAIDSQAPFCKNHTCIHVPL